MEKVIVFGNGVFAEHISFLLKHDALYEIAAFTVDAPYIKEGRLNGLPVVPFEEIESLYPPPEYRMTVSLGFQRVNRLREQKYLEAKRKGYHLINYLSTMATSFPNLVVGDNCIVLENAILGPYVRIGNDVIIASGAIIGHHVTVRDHCFISPGAVILGGAMIEEYSFVGANATVKEEVRIARESLIGSGVSITRNTVERGVYLNPPPELQSKRSNELQTLLMWPVRSHREGRPQGEGTAA